MGLISKLIMSFFQIATKVPTVYQVRMPPAVQAVVQAFGFASLDLDSLGLSGTTARFGFLLVEKKCSVTRVHVKIGEALSHP